METDLLWMETGRRSHDLLSMAREWECVMKDRFERETSIGALELSEWFGESVWEAGLHSVRY